MVDGRTGGERLGGRLAGFRDLAVLAACDVLAVGWLLGPVPRLAVLDTIVTLGFLCVLPGYAFLAALLPDTARAGSDDWRLALTGFERIAFAVAGSVALVMLVGGALAFSSYGLNRWTVAGATGLLTLGLTGLAAGRRALAIRDASEGTGGTTGDRRASGGSTGLVGAFDGTERDDVPSPFAVGLAVLCIVAVAAVGAVAVAPDERYTEASVLSRADGGALRADAHPGAVAAGEPTPFWVRLSNHEGRSNLYTVVVRAERVGDDAETVASARELDRFTVAIPVGGTRTARHDVRLGQPGRVRLRFLVYEGDLPATPRPANADHALHVWLTVEADATGDGDRDGDGGGQ